MKWDPQVSIVMPVYNGGLFLNESIRSCLCQTYDNLELVVVDDGSTDTSPRVIEEFGASDQRVRTIQHTRNRGLSHSLNTGLREARGTFLTWTSADNYYSSNAIARMKELLDENPSVDFVYSSYRTVDKTGATVGEVTAKQVEALVDENCIGPCFLYRQRVYQKLGGFDSQIDLAEDYEYWLRVSHKFVMAPIAEPLYYYRLHDSSLTARFGSRKVLQATELARQNSLYPGGIRRSKLWGKVYATKAFAAYSLNDKSRVSGNAIRAIVSDPQLIRNRGLVSIAVEGVLGTKVAQVLRRFSAAVLAQ